MLSHVRLFATPWTIARQTPAVYGISQARKLELVKVGVGCRFLLQGVFLTQGLNLCLLHWQADSTSTATWEVPVYFKTQKFASRVTVIFYFLIKKVYFALTLGKVPLVNCVWSWSASSSLPGTTHHCLSFLCFIYALGTTTSWVTAVLHSDTNSLIPSGCSYTTGIELEFHSNANNLDLVLTQVKGSFFTR